ncbi:MAG: hypothetical protein ABR986_03765 [Methanomassiliicoccales archaeon]|jgi:hypothetical protein
MTRVQISEHVWVNISRRNLCDNCVADVCLKRTGDNIDHCELFKSAFIAFKKCNHCGEIYELFSNFRALDYDMCPNCNEKMKVIPVQVGEPMSTHC